MLDNNYTDWKNDLVPLHQQSKEAKGKGYSIDWKNKVINGSRQSVLGKIYYETFEDYLFFIGKNKDYNRIREAREILLTEFAALKEWTDNNPDLLLTYHSD